MIAQVHSNTMYEYQALKTEMPFDSLDEWQRLQSMTPGNQLAAMADTDTRRRLVEAMSAMRHAPNYEQMMVVESIQGADKSVAELARQAQKSTAEVVLDHLFASEKDAFFRVPFANQRDEEILGLMRHPQSVVTFSDSGAHVSQIADFSLHTHFLSHWVRERGAFTLEEAIRRITSEIAIGWGFHDRGVIAVGKKADITIFDPDTIAPLMPEVAMDLPLNGVRLRQGATGIHATLVNGEVLMRNTEHTGALPGRVLKH